MGNCRLDSEGGVAKVTAMSDAPVTHPSKLSKGHIFFRRLLSTVMLWGIVLGAIFSGNKILSDYVFLAIMMMLAGFGLVEFYGLVEKSGLVCYKTIGVVGGLVLMRSAVCRSRSGVIHDPRCRSLICTTR